MAEGFLALPEAWRLAIAREEHSRELYAQMAREAADPSVRALFEDLSRQEAGHKQRLEAEYLRTFEQEGEPGGEPGGTAIPWMEWSEEAFALAKRLDALVLLDITASWCHWCHVMDRETYSDPEVLEVIKRGFVPVRVDTDKRPDVNERYNMGGWPTTAVLTPEGDLVTGATYVPPVPMLRLLRQMAATWERDKESMQERLRAGRTGAAPPPPLVEPALEHLDAIMDAIGREFDPVFGGFGDAPKFPQTDALELALASSWLRRRSEDAEVADKTLRAMARGAMYDAEEGGFFRYATRRDFGEPHYEKLVDENARLLSLYVRAYIALGDEEYSRIARGIIEYMDGTLWSEKRGYFAASQDADEEYYKLPRQERSKRTAPQIDTTFFADRNAFVASAYLAASAALGEAWHGERALRVLDAIWSELRHAGAGVHHYMLDEPALPGLLRDQIVVAWAELDAYEHSAVEEHLDRARELAELVNNKFRGEEGGFFDSVERPDAIGYLSRRERPLWDNALVARLGARLSRLTGDESYREMAQRALLPFGAIAPEQGLFAAPYGLALLELHTEPLRVVIVGRREDPATASLRSAALAAYTPVRSIQTVDPEWEPERLARLGYEARVEATAYPCLGQACGEPARTPDALAESIAALAEGR